MALYLLAVTATQGGIAGSLLILAVGLASGVRPIAVLAAVRLVLVGEVVAGLVKQRRGTLTTSAPESGP